MYSAAHAQVNTWIGPDGGSWADGANWSDGVPGEFENALVNEGFVIYGPDVSTAYWSAITIGGSDLGGSTASLTVNNTSFFPMTLTIGRDAGSNGEVTMASGSNFGGFDVTVGEYGTGKLTLSPDSITGFTNGLSSSLRVGRYAGSSGILIMEDSSAYFFGDASLTLADAGSATVTLTRSGIIAEEANIEIGKNGGLANVTIDGGGIVAKSIMIGSISTFKIGRLSGIDVSDLLDAGSSQWEIGPGGKLIAGIEDPGETTIGTAIFGEDARITFTLDGLTDQGRLKADYLTLDGTLALSLLDDFTPEFGDSFDLLDFTTLTGSFSTIELPSLAPGLNWDLGQLYTTGIIGVVPEPSALSLLVLASALGLLLRRSRA